MNSENLTINQLESMPVIIAMKRQAPLESGVVNIPVPIPLELYRRVGDMEHDDYVVLATLIARAVGIMHRDLLPCESGFDSIVEDAMRMQGEMEDWLRDETAYSLEDGLVNVCIPIPQEFFARNWSHWLGVSIGQYAARCIKSTIAQLEENCGVERGTFVDSLLAETC